MREQDIEKVPATPTHAEAAERVCFEELGVRDRLWSRLRLEGRVALMDQSDLPIAYRRYLPYQRFPCARYGIGCYRGDDAVIVSVGENPWAAPGPVHLSELCKGYYGERGRAEAGVARAERARALTLDGEAGEPWSDGARLAAKPRDGGSPYGREGQKRSPRIWIDLGSILDRERKKRLKYPVEGLQTTITP